jgi:hypothetical protein
MEGRLRRLTERSWKCWLHGYRVHIGEIDGRWYVWLIPGGEWTERCLRVGSIAEGAKLARECGVTTSSAVGRFRSTPTPAAWMIAPPFAIPFDRLVHNCQSGDAVPPLPR